MVRVKVVTVMHRMKDSEQNEDDEMKTSTLVGKGWSYDRALYCIYFMTAP